MTLRLGSYIRQHDVDLVVAEARFRGGLSTDLFGSTTDSLLHDLSCDVLLVPNVPLASIRK
jgi:nucleotide-binding universal stress UspA family protein